MSRPLIEAAAVPGYDLSWCLRLNRLSAHWRIRRFFSVISRLGDGVFWYSLMALLALFGGTHGRQAALHLALTGIVALSLYRTLKRWTRRPRPFAQHRSVIAYLPPLDEFSFPSGHTLHAVSFTLVALAYFPPLAWVLLPFATLIALSRIVLGLHYPSDVLAAIAIGSALAGLSLYLLPAVGA